MYVVLGLSTPAAATQYLITIGGTLVREASVPTLFGNPAREQQFTISFVIDSAFAHYVPAGSNYGPGLTLQNESFRIDRGDIGNFQFSLSGANFTAADFQAQSIGNLGNHDILIEGSLANPVAGNMIFSNSDGAFYSSIFSCHATLCATIPVSYAFSYADGGTGLAQDDVYIRSELFSAVPEPATWVMMVAGFGMVGGVMRRRPVARAIA